MTKSDRTTRILFDAGVTPHGLVDNMRRLELSPRDIDIIVLSHGHWDHTTGMDGLVSELGGHAQVPVLIHPEFWSRRRIALPGRDPIQLPSTSKPALEGSGKPVPAGIDGEATVLTAPLRFRIRPAALRVRIAPGHPGASPSASRPANVWRGLRALVSIAAGRTAAPGPGRTNR